MPNQTALNTDDKTSMHVFTGVSTAVERLLNRVPINNTFLFYDTACHSCWWSCAMKYQAMDTSCKANPTHSKIMGISVPDVDRLRFLDDVYEFFLGDSQCIRKHVHLNSLHFKSLQKGVHQNPFTNNSAGAPTQSTGSRILRVSATVSSTYCR